jgi:hypothetical protein
MLDYDNDNDNDKLDSSANIRRPQAIEAKRAPSADGLPCMLEEPCATRSRLCSIALTSA